MEGPAESTGKNSKIFGGPPPPHIRSYSIIIIYRCMTVCVCVCVCVRVEKYVYNVQVFLL